MQNQLVFSMCTESSGRVECLQDQLPISLGSPHQGKEQDSAVPFQVFATVVDQQAFVDCLSNRVPIVHDEYSGHGQPGCDPGLTLQRYLQESSRNCSPLPLYLAPILEGEGSGVRGYIYRVSQA